jgi:hypothetical protein
MVGLPPDFAMRFDPAKQEAMLAHELAHLAAHDPFWCLLADVATVVLWCHPGVWWLRRQLHLASEMAADEASLLVADGPRVLAECLVELGARLTGPVLGQLRVSGVPLAFGSARAAVGASGRARVVAAAATWRRADDDFWADGHDGHRGAMHSLGRPPRINDRRQYENDAT